MAKVWLSKRGPEEAWDRTVFGGAGAAAGALLLP